MQGPDALFECVALRCRLRGRVCVRRQVEVERELQGDLAPRSSRRKRGIGPEFVLCWRCPQGAAIRAELGDEVADVVRTGGRGDVAVTGPLLRAWLMWAAPTE